MMLTAKRPGWLSGLFKRSARSRKSGEEAALAALQLSKKRKSQREVLAVVVREGLLRSGILSHQCKFKMLMLDRRAESFIVLIEVADGASVMDDYRRGQCEVWVRHMAFSLHRVNVVSVFWRRAKEPGLSRPAPLNVNPDLGETHYAQLED